MTYDEILNIGRSQEMESLQGKRAKGMAGYTATNGLNIADAT